MQTRYHAGNFIHYFSNAITESQNGLPLSPIIVAATPAKGQIQPICSMLSVASELIILVGTMLRNFDNVGHRFGLVLSYFFQKRPQLYYKSHNKADNNSDGGSNQKINYSFPADTTQFLRSPILEAPTASEANTIGTISILISRIKRSPTGLSAASWGK